MTDTSNGAYAPGIYVKGDVARVAKTASQAVAFVFDGFKRQEDAAPVEETPADEAPESVATPDGLSFENRAGDTVHLDSTNTPALTPRPQAPKTKDVVKP